MERFILFGSVVLILFIVFKKNETYNNNKIVTNAIYKKYNDFDRNKKQKINYVFNIIKKLQKIKNMKNNGIDYYAITKIIKFNPDSIGYNMSKEMYDYFSPKPDKNTNSVFKDYCKIYPNDKRCKKIDCKSNNLLPGCQTPDQIQK